MTALVLAIAVTAAAGRSLWVVSESGTRHYQAMGGRPVVPMLVRLELRDFDRWRRPDCSV